MNLTLLWKARKETIVELAAQVALTTKRVNMMNKNVSIMFYLKKKTLKGAVSQPDKKADVKKVMYCSLKESWTLRNHISN